MSKRPTAATLALATSGINWLFCPSPMAAKMMEKTAMKTSLPDPTCPEAKRMAAIQKVRPSTNMIMARDIPMKKELLMLRSIAILLISSRDFSKRRQGEEEGGDHCGEVETDNSYHSGDEVPDLLGVCGQFAGDSARSVIGLVIEGGRQFKELAEDVNPNLADNAVPSESKAELKGEVGQPRYSGYIQEVQAQFVNFLHVIEWVQSAGKACMT
ncbi:unnamed protein product [Sphagnum balticum]